MNSEFEPEDLSSLFDEELTPSESERVRQQVERAPDQQALLEEFAQIRSLLRELPQESAPAGLAESIRNQIASEKRPSAATIPAHSRLQRWRWVVSSLTACGLAVIGMVYYQSTESSSTPATSDMLVAEADTANALGIDREADFLAGHPQGSERQMATEFHPSTLESTEGKEVPEIASTMMSEAPSPATARMMRSVPGAAQALSDIPEDRESFGATLSAIPAAPPISDEVESQIARLAASPKWRNKFRPGELVRYITVEEDEVAVVELSVVDVAHFYGEMQVLLAGQQIRPLQESVAVHATNGPADMHDANLEKQNANAELDDFNNGGSGEQNGLLAVYVEATGDQVLRSLEMLESRKDLEGINLGTTLASNREMLSVIAMNESEPQPAANDGVDGKEVSRESLAFLLEPAAETEPGPRHLRRSQASPELAETEQTDSLKVDKDDAADDAAVAGAASDPPAMSGKKTEGSVAESSQDKTGMSSEHAAKLAYQVPARVRPLPQPFALPGNAMAKGSRPARIAKEKVNTKSDGAESLPLQVKQGIASVSAGEARCRILFVLAPAGTATGSGLQPAAEPVPAAKPVP
ncbi:MAG: anti-sigma factor family protein [Rubinisphaera brasiliensis]|uniref:anti-sigma factor family protein n=1 Tax=Rubinisphaera brasiliensis TaxID=119 RepID=UPI003919BE8F